MRDGSGDCYAVIIGAGYIRSVAKCNVETVVSAADPLPGLAELTLIQYFALKKGF
jgi:hypothetical protein